MRMGTSSKGGLHGEGDDDGCRNFGWRRSWWQRAAQEAQGRGRLEGVQGDGDGGAGCSSRGARGD
jgi:hypothetical protein